MTPLKPGTIFAERYVLVEQIGFGGFSEVWKVKRESGFIQAIKIFVNLDRAGVDIAREEFERMFDLNHNRLLKASDYGVYKGSPYLVMPYCKNGSALRKIGSVSEADLARVLFDIASALEYLHGLKDFIIHQDIKPDNFLIAEDGNYLLSDFGISKKLKSHLSQASQRSSATHLKQSKVSGVAPPAYRAPETFSADLEDRKPVKANDIWALGASVYEMATAELPFGDFGGVIQNQGAQIPLLPAHKFSRELSHILHWCLQLHPWDRPTAGQLRYLAEGYLRSHRWNIKAPEPHYLAPTIQSVPDPIVHLFHGTSKLNHNAAELRVKKGEVLTLQWKTSYTDRIYITDIGEVSNKKEGSINIKPTASKIYNLVVSNVEGKQVTKSISVTIEPRATNIPLIIVIAVGSIIGLIWIGNYLLNYNSYDSTFNSKSVVTEPTKEEITISEPTTPTVQSGTIVGNTVMLRSTPEVNFGRKNTKVSLKRGDQVTIIGEEIPANNSNAHIILKKTTFYPTNGASNFEVAKGIAVRYISAYDENYATIEFPMKDGSLQPGYVLTSDLENMSNKKWYNVAYNGQSGWIYGPFVKLNALESYEYVNEDPAATVIGFINSLGSRDFIAAYARTNLPAWSSKGVEWFSSNEGFGTISRTSVEDHRILENNANTAKVYIKYYAEDPVNDIKVKTKSKLYCASPGIYYEQDFNLEKKYSGWKIIKTSLRNCKCKGENLWIQ